MNLLREATPHVQRPVLPKANLLPPGTKPVGRMRAVPFRSPEDVRRKLASVLLVGAGAWLALWTAEPFASGVLRIAINAAEGVIWGVFAGELVARMILSKQRSAFLRRNAADALCVLVPWLHMVRSAPRLVAKARGIRAAQIRLLQRLATIAGVTGFAIVGVGRLLAAAGVLPIAAALQRVALASLTGGDLGTPHPLADTAEIVLAVVHIALIAVVAGTVAAFFLARDGPQRAVDLDAAP